MTALRVSSVLGALLVFGCSNRPSAPSSVNGHPVGGAPASDTLVKSPSTFSETELAAVQVPVFAGQPVPSSPRSRDAIAGIAPRLVLELQGKGLAYGAPVYMRIFKTENVLEVWLKRGARFERFRSYPIAAFSGDLGPKLKEGDRQAPEGFYFVPPSAMNPRSRLHLSFNLGYPNVFDRAHARTGSALMVHGGSASIGCYAMTDAGVTEIYALADAALRNGQRFFRVHCFPFRMTAANMNGQRDNKWFSFWQNLKQGHDFFERTGNPPDVVVRERRYCFETAND
jgi:murein L,D-transpeptidase YafK